VTPRLPHLPPFALAALLLDLDGTLLDIAPTPDSVQVPPALPDTLRTLSTRLGGALAIISGRTVAEVDALLGAVSPAVAGEHGGALRRAPGAALERPDLPAAPQAWRDAAQRLVAAHPGALLEHKPRGFVVHYRLAPAAGPALHAALAALLAGQAAFDLMQAHMAWEVRPRGADKGTAVAALLRAAPFAGRLPVFIGDDVTDRDAIAAAAALGGTGMLVADAFGTPAGVRAWLATVAEQGWD
jgi:trehalose 6-phosphate phosphatase